MLFIFILTLSLIWSVATLLSCLLYPSAWLYPFSIHHFLVFFSLWHSNMFQAQFILSLNQVWNQPFLQRALVPFNGECYLKTKNWTQDVIVAIRIWLPQAFSVDIAKEHALHSWVCTHTRHIYIYIYSNLNILKTMSSRLVFEKHHLPALKYFEGFLLSLQIS